MANEANIKAVITADDKASSVLRGFGDNVDGLSNKISSVLKVAAEGALVAGAAIVSFATLSIKAYAEHEEVLAQVNQVLLTTGKSANISSGYVEDLAMSMERYSGRSHDAIAAGETLLLQFSQTTKENLPQFTKAMVDLSQRMGIDMPLAAKTLGIALDDPLVGMARLRKGGIDFTADQKAAIKAMVETGDIAGADAILMQGLQDKVGGAAGAYRHTLGGALESIKQSFHDVEEAIGGTLVRGLEPLAQRLSVFVQSDKFQAWLQTAVDWLNKELPIAADYVINTLLPALKKAFDDIWPVIKDVIKWAGDMFKFIDDHKWVVWALVGAFAALKVAMFLEGALSAFKAVIGGMTTVFTGFTDLLASPILLPALVIAAVLGSIYEIWNAYDTVRKNIEDASKSVENLANSNKAVIEPLNEQLKGTGAEAERAQAALLKLGVPAANQQAINQQLLGPGNHKFASGTDYAPGGAALVGENGPEVINLPRGSKVTPNNKLGNSVNITINTGAMMGNDVEARKFAQLIVKHYNDAMSSKSGMVMA